MVWLKCSGAYNLMTTNPGYYELLKRNTIDYPSGASFQIEKDLTRTFPHEKDPQKLEEMTSRVRNVLQAYV